MIDKDRGRQMNRTGEKVPWLKTLATNSDYSSVVSGFGEEK